MRLHQKFWMNASSKIRIHRGGLEFSFSFTGIWIWQRKVPVPEMNAVWSVWPPRWVPGAIAEWIWGICHKKPSLNITWDAKEWILHYTNKSIHWWQWMRQMLVMHAVEMDLWLSWMRQMLVKPHWDQFWPHFWPCKLHWARGNVSCRIWNLESHTKFPIRKRSNNSPQSMSSLKRCNPPSSK